jgi:hypothetical protein
MKKVLLIAIATLTSIFAINAQEKCDALDANMMFANNALQSSLNSPFHVITDDMQKLLFTPDVWKAEMAKFLNCPVSSFPANWDESVRENVARLKQIADTNGKTLAWKDRPFQRPVEQALVKSKYTAKYPGLTIYKIGSNYKDWNVFKNSLGIPTNRYIRGEILLKIPGRPYCQAQEWVVKQAYKGGRYGASIAENIGGAGYFVQCPQ